MDPADLTLGALLGGHCPAEWRDRRPISADPVGAGESYRVVRLTLPGAIGLGTSVILRIARRPRPDMARDRRAEFAALSRLPAGLGPVPLVLSADSDPVWMTQSVVPGRVRVASHWTSADVGAAARALAELHGVRPREDDHVTEGFADVAGDLRSSVTWWHEQHNEVFGIDGVRTAAEAVRDRLDRLSLPGAGGARLIHGDAVATNVLLDGGGLDDQGTETAGPTVSARLIDTEWTRFGDPAWDLGQIAGEVAVDPWYVPLDAAGVERLLAVYAEARAAMGDPADVEALALRTHAWMLSERTTMLLYLARRELEHVPEPGRYRELRQSLTEQLLRAASSGA